jgi:hypothetical protein
MNKRILWLLLLILLLLSGEGLAFLSTWITPNLYDHRDAVFAEFTPEDLEKFRSRAASSTLGWDNVPGRRETPNCLNKTQVVTVSSDRVRVHGSPAAGNIRVLVTGDSYTFGDEAEDHETFPAMLERNLGVRVANLGVGGYDPTQAVLKLEQTIDRYPQAQVAVLAIQTENVLRMLNSYRPVYYKGTGIRYGFKPFMGDGMLRPLIDPDPWSSLDKVTEVANQAFDTDYWRKPRAKFPFTIAFAKAITSNTFLVELKADLADLLRRPTYIYIVGASDVEHNLTAILDRFVSFSVKRHLVPVIAMIPKSGDDPTSGASMLAQAITPALAGSLVVVNVGEGVDWSRYNLGGRRRTCHPSAYGYATIAESVAAPVRRLLATRLREPAG